MSNENVENPPVDPEKFGEEENEEEWEEVGQWEEEVGVSEQPEADGDEAATAPGTGEESQGQDDWYQQYDDQDYQQNQDYYGDNPDYFDEYRRWSQEGSGSENQEWRSQGRTSGSEAEEERHSFESNRTDDWPDWWADQNQYLPYNEFDGEGGDYMYGTRNSNAEDEEGEDEEGSPEESNGAEEEGSQEQGSKESTSSGKRKKDKLPPVELGKRSFRWFERKILAEQIPNSEENLRRKRLLEKCQMVRKVSKPVVSLFDAKTRETGEKKVSTSAKGSKESVVVGEAVSQISLQESDNQEDEEGSASGTEQEKTFRDYTEHDWAMKNTIDFLTTQGCSDSSARSYGSSLRAMREDADFRLDLYEHQLQHRRNAIGNAQGAPQITDAVRRGAERAVWRAVIDNTKPRFPLPRFILPRHQYLKKVQAQFLGPGSYELDVFEAQTKARKLRMPSTWSGCSRRFPKDAGEDDEDSTGAGGGKGGGATGGTILRDPWKALDEANLRHKYPGNYVPFESTPKNFRKGLGEGDSRVPPNAYNIKSPMEEFISKKTSLRGPYDCYTPSRGIIPYGYYKSQTEEHGRLGPGTYEIRKSLLKEMNDSYNFFKYTFGKAERNKMFGFKAAFDKPLWPKDDPSMPGVGQYDPDIDSIGRDKKQNIAPFKIQSGLKKREVKKPDLTAPDYYFFGKASWTIPPKGASLASVFKSKTPQVMPSKMHRIRKQRNKASNKKLDLEGLGQGYTLEEHYAYDIPTRNTYVLEDCQDGPCKGGPKVDPFAIPGYGVIDGKTPAVQRRGGGCCGF